MKIIWCRGIHPTSQTISCALFPHSGLKPHSPWRITSRHKFSTRRTNVIPLEWSHTTFGPLYLHTQIWKPFIHFREDSFQTRVIRLRISDEIRSQSSFMISTGTPSSPWAYPKSIRPDLTLQWKLYYTCVTISLFAECSLIYPYSLQTDSIKVLQRVLSIYLSF